MFRSCLVPQQAHKVLRTSTTRKLWTIRQEMLEKNMIKTAAANKTSSGGAKSTTAHTILEKPASASSVEITMPFRSDEQIRAEYLSVASLDGKPSLRFGKILEDLDAIACTVANAHADDGHADTRAPTVVTGAIERIDVQSQLHFDHDLRMSSRVTWSGSSSLVVAVSLHDITANAPVLDSSFLLVTLGDDGRPIPINKLQLDVGDEEQRKTFDAAARENEERRERRKLLKASTSSVVFDLQHFAQSTEAIELMKVKLHEQQQRRKATSDASDPHPIPMRKAVHIATHLTFAQDANAAGSVFGGLLLARSYELAWIAAFQQLGSLPNFLCLDDVAFHHPVKVGSICRYTATVGYVHPNRRIVQVGVTCEVSDPVTKTRKLTNTFEYLFIPAAADAGSSPPPLAADVTCETYEDWIRWNRGREVTMQAEAEACKGGGGKTMRIREFL